METVAHHPHCDGHPSGYVDIAGIAAEPCDGCQAEKRATTEKRVPSIWQRLWAKFKFSN